MLVIKHARVKANVVKGAPSIALITQENREPIDDAFFSRYSLAQKVCNLIGIKYSCLCQGNSARL